MRNLFRSKLFLVAAIVTTIALSVSFSPVHLYSLPTTHAASADSYGSVAINCASPRSFLCVDVHASDKLFGYYVGHDEPSTLFYSNQPGSGNRMRYQLTLPTDPAGNQPKPGQSYNFQLHPAFWFGMAMCATQSYPELVSTCKPDSDSNIVDPAVSPNHPGMAFMELQFYPPGWAPWPAGNSCDPHDWCAALTIDSLAQNPVTGATLNNTCTTKVGLEYVNFAFLTKNGRSQAPANPVQATTATYTPNENLDLFMQSGDKLAVTLHDTPQGLQTVVQDMTTGQTGSMVASTANDFGQVEFAPNPSKECMNIPYNFHPMYSTSSEQTRVTWAAHSYNIAFSDEIGHFDYCNGASFAPTANCPKTNTEGVIGDRERSDVDDTFCFPASYSLYVRVSGCQGTNDPGFDGVPYKQLWPDGNPQHPSPILFSSPLTGDEYGDNYNRMAFETDLPTIEFAYCNIQTGANCTRIPITDDGTPANFYPFFTAGEVQNNHCVWTLGNDIPGITRQDFGKNEQYGDLLGLSYTVQGGGSTVLYTDYRQIHNQNPCLANASN